MTRESATLLCHQELIKNGLSDWHVRLTNDSNNRFLGLCSHKDRCIILNAHHIDMHPDEEISNTILHEIAHALTPGEGHNEKWAHKAREIGCKNTFPCSNLFFPSDVLDAIRSGAAVKVEFDEEIIRHPRYEITRLQNKCADCGKVAVEKSSTTINTPGDTTPDIQITTLECGHCIVKDIPKGTPFHKLISNSDGNTCNHKFEKNKCSICNEFMPYEFQLEGMKFAEKAIVINKGALIADQMGLGKTIQALGIIKYHPELWPVLYVVKSGIKFQWFKQIMTWLGPSHLPQMIETSNDYLIPNLKGYIIGYDMLVPKTRKSKSGKIIQQGFSLDKLKERGIKTIVLDECQQIMNPDSTRTQQVRKLAKETKVIGLSGTPWKNRGSELFSILNMIAPNKFPSFEGFKSRWVNYVADPITGKTKEGGINDPQRFKDYISDIAIRREREEVMKDLPIINRMKLHCELDTISQKTYDEHVSEFVKWYNEYIISGTEDQMNGINILAKMSRMRHITGLAKIPATIEFATEFFTETERSLVIGVHHKDVAQILKSNIQEANPNVQILELSSMMSGQERFDVVTKFNERQSCLICSTLAGGEGVDGLQGSCYDIMLHERQWNPANEEQLESRLIRIGQESKSVNGTYVEAEDSIDTLFDGIVERKRRQFHEAHSNSEAPSWSEGDLGKELAHAIVARFNEKNRKRA